MFLRVTPKASKLTTTATTAILEAGNSSDKFDLYKDDKVEQSGTPSPITIADLTPNTQYDNYSFAYASKSDKTALSFKTIAQAVTGISLDKTTLALNTGASATVKATIVPANATDKAFTFSSADTKFATVDSSGKITAIKAGTVVITVTTHDGAKTAKVTVTITDPVVKVNSFKVGDGSLKLTGETGTKSDEFAITDILPANATSKDIAFTSSDESIVTIASTGSYKYQATYAKAGTAKLTFSSKDGGAHYDIDVVVADPAPETPTEP